jgi:DNA polymerase-3 subunit gamma/tau
LFSFIGFRLQHHASNVSVSTYQVIARKWRPQRFDEVIGQRGVTQTLQNAIAANRIAQSFVFAGPRGVGKTTTARILARGLNCVKGPTVEPCGVCDACVEIAQGRDIDVLEIDAATNTQVDKVREIIIAGLAIAPVRNRFKIFIIDEVHRLSAQAFDALLKSIEEPPPHVVFMMATTEIEKVPPTIQSRSQVFELKTIGVKAIADQLRKIADAEKIQIDDAAVALLARAGDGSMRDAQSAFDQVIAFAGTTITAEDVAREDAGAVFDLAGRAVEAGYDLRLVIRELARLTRDLLVVRIDASRLNDPEIAAEGERDALATLASQFSHEDLMRAFDVLTKADYDIRASTQPRYHLELALLRWIHLRRLVPLSDIIQEEDRDPSRAAPGRRTRRPSGSARMRRARVPWRKPRSRMRRPYGQSKPAGRRQAGRRRPRRPLFRLRARASRTRCLQKSRRRKSSSTEP